MDAGWPKNPSNAVICILCKRVVPYIQSDPQHYFRHLIKDHSAYFNLNLLLDLSLGHPRIAVGSNVSNINWNNPQHQQQNINQQQHVQLQEHYNNRNALSLPQIFLNDTSEASHRQKQQQYQQQLYKF